MRFKTTVGVHPAYIQSISVPLPLVRHYRELGLDNNLLIYVQQIMAAYWRGEEANHSSIAKIMHCGTRTLRGYNGRLQDAGLVKINGRYLHGNRLENDYDLTPLLDAAALLLHTDDQETAVQKNAYRLVDQLVTAMERGEDVSGMLLDLAAEWRKSETLTDYEPTGKILPVETGKILPVETGKILPVSTGKELPVSTGKELPVVTSSSQPEKYCRLKPEKDFLCNVVGSPHSLKENNNNILRQLHAVGLENGAARRVVKSAIDRWGDDALAVMGGWLAYVDAQDTLRNPAGLIYSRIVKDGERPPVMTEPAVTDQAVTEPALVEV